MLRGVWFWGDFCDTIEWRTIVIEVRVLATLDPLSFLVPRVSALYVDQTTAVCANLSPNYQFEEPNLSTFYQAVLCSPSLELVSITLGIQYLFSPLFREFDVVNSEHFLVPLTLFYWGCRVE